MPPLTFLETHFKAAKNEFKSKNDAAILFIHWKLISLGFKSAGLIPEEEPEQQNVDSLSELLPDGWNDDQSNYRLRYVRENTPFNLAVIRTGKGNNTLVAALLNIESDSVQSFVINVADEITDDFQVFKTCYKDLGQLNERLETVLNLPFTQGKKARSGAQHKPTRDECTAVIRHILEEQLPNAGFSDDDIRRLVNAICRPSGEGRVPGSRPSPPPRYPEPDFPVVPPPRGLIDPLGGRPLGPIGRSDLDPLGIGGGGIPLGPSIPAGPGFGPPGGGGSLFDPFGRGSRRQPGIPGNLPPGAVPPGARFDPTGPVHPDEMFPGFHNINRGKGPGAGKGKGPSRPGAGPDPDHMSPPGYDDMFS